MQRGAGGQPQGHPLRLGPFTRWLRGRWQTHFVAARQHHGAKWACQQLAHGQDDHFGTGCLWGSIDTGLQHRVGPGAELGQVHPAGTAAGILQPGHQGLLGARVQAQGSHHAGASGVRHQGLPDPPRLQRRAQGAQPGVQGQAPGRHALAHRLDLRGGSGSRRLHAPTLSPIHPAGPVPLP